MQARDVEDFAQRFEQEVMDFVQPLFQGFLRRPIPTLQSPDCLYSEPPPAAAAHAAGAGGSLDSEEEEDEEEEEVVRVPKPLVAAQGEEEEPRPHQRLRTSPK
jgi:hypothetical protein